MVRPFRFVLRSNAMPNQSDAESSPLAVRGRKFQRHPIAECDRAILVRVALECTAGSPFVIISVRDALSE